MQYEENSTLKFTHKSGHDQYSHQSLSN